MWNKKLIDALTIKLNFSVFGKKLLVNLRKEFEKCNKRFRDSVYLKAGVAIWINSLHKES